MQYICSPIFRKLFIFKEQNLSTDKDLVEIKGG